MDRRLLTDYRAPQRPPVFNKELPKATVKDGPDWLLILAAILAGVALVALAVTVINDLPTIPTL